jgi:hypothetical protein
MNNESEKIREDVKISVATFWKQNDFHTLFFGEVKINILY